jgi:peptidoglycan/LPS O-acetylase OafA/YrhL
MSQPAATQKAEKRVPGIDLLRGLCIVAVVLHHINLRIHFRDSSLGQMIGPAANRVLFWNGYYGVRMFFVISGFLITTWSLLSAGAASAGSAAASFTGCALPASCPAWPPCWYC